MNYLFVYFRRGIRDVILHFFSEILDHLLTLDGKFIILTVVDDGTLSYAFHIEPELVETSVVSVG